MSNILVTGGAGFIGSHLCEALLKQGSSVIALDNFNNFYNPLIKRNNVEEIEQTARKYNASFTLIEGDILNTILLDSIFADYNISTVVHLAAYAGVRPSIENPKLYTEVNVTGTVNILEAMRKYEIQKLIFASSSSVYGNNTKVPFSETDPVDKAISPYAATKKAGEVLCYTYHHLYDINTACLRFFTVYGPRQRPDLAIHKFLKLISEHKPFPFFGDGSMRRDHTFIDDIISGVLKSIEWVRSNEKRYDIFNLGNSQTVTLSELVKTIERVTGKTATLEHHPQPPGDVDITYADITHSKKIFDYNPKTKLKKGIEKELEWILKLC